MPAPHPGQVLYRFAPPGNSWTGTEEHAYHCWYDYYNHINTCHGSTISDEYDFRVLSDTAPNYGAPDAYAWKQTSNPGATTYAIQRVLCTFSLSVLPPSGESQSIVGITFYDTLDPEPGSWDWDAFVYVKPSGVLTFSPSLGPDSVKTISAGTSYQLELYILYDNANSTSTYQIWIDDELWLSMDDALYWTYEAYTQLIAGMESNPYKGICDVTMHVGDIVWTIEKFGGARWTMMAP